MSRINIKCDCGVVHDVPRDNDAPKNATSMGCNWCPTCQKEDEYYQEWYNYDEAENYEPNDPNQLVLFSIVDDILENHEVNELTQIQ